MIEKASLRSSNALYIPKLGLSRYWFCNENYIAAAAPPGSSLGLCMSWLPEF